MANRITLSQLKIILLSSLGGMLEFYDFVIFAVFALPIGKTFFPSQSPILDIMAGFAAFAVGYLARPFGGILFSHFGDKYGRRRAFLITIIMMGGATLLMGALPGYVSYGIAMPIIFLLLRIIQGIAVGGEIPGAITYVSEHISHRKALACGIVFLFINFGIVAAELISTILEDTVSIGPHQLAAWRIAFFIGGTLAFVSYFLRHKLEESPEYIQFKHKVVAVPLLTLLKTQKARILSGVMLIAIQATLVSMIYLFATQYMKLTQLYSDETISAISLTSLIVFSLGCGLWGWVADYLGKHKILLVGTILLIIMSYLFYRAIHQQHYAMLFAVLVSIPTSMIAGCLSAVLPELFPVNVRYSGIALCYNLGFAIFGGLTPLIATYLMHRFNLIFAPAYIMMLIAAIGILAIYTTFQQIKHSN